MKNTMKKVISVLLATIIIFGSAPLAGLVGLELPSFGDLFESKAEASEETELTEGYYTYTVTDGKAEITAVDESISGKITIPSTLGGYPVTSIGDLAFFYFTSLESVTIPDSVTSIGKDAFYGCTSLASVTIPDSVTSIGNAAFCDCTSLANIIVDSNNKNYSNDEYGVLFNKEKTELIQYPIGNSRTSYTIPNSVTSIGDNAFSDCTSLESVTIPDSVTSIGSCAFNYCTNLTNITFGNDSQLTSIDIWAFKNCTSLESITIPDSVTSIGNYAFSGCTSLKSVTFGDDSQLTSIDWYTFYNCTSLESVTIPNSVTSIGDGVFKSCTSLESVTIPDSVTSIGSCAFDNCKILTNITFGDDSQLTSIGSSAFKKCTNLESITIPDSVTSIVSYAFSGCTSLENITIPDSVTGIVSYAFYDTAYYNNKSNWENGVLYIGNHLIEAKSTLSGSYVVKDGTKTIADSAFKYCSRLESITIPDSVTSIGYSVFEGTAYYNNEANWESNVLYIGNHLIKAKETISGSYAVKNGTKTIADGAFYDSNLESVTIPNSVTSIGSYAFKDCTSLTDVYYTGTESKWNSIAIGDYNECLTNATIHFNSVMPTTPTDPTDPTTKPTTPTDPEVVIQPSQTSINYGDSIILHVDASKIPAGGRVEWTADNGNFSYDASADGSTCKITPKSSGTTTFTATVYDKDGNVVSSDTQQMKSKAGVWEKIIAFFKNLFGLTKTYPNTFKDIF